MGVGVSASSAKAYSIANSWNQQLSERNKYKRGQGKPEMIKYMRGQGKPEMNKYERGRQIRRGTKTVRGSSSGTRSH